MVETVSQILLNILRLYPKPDLFLYKEKGRYVPISTHDFGRRVRHFALGLGSLGTKAGDKIVILAENSPLWIAADFAGICLGAVTVPIYPTLTTEQILYIIDDSDASVVLCSSPALWSKVKAVRDRLPKVSRYISFQASAPDGAMSFDETAALGRDVDDRHPGLFEKAALGIVPTDLASIIYTSGTTGVPKGVMLTHDNFVSNITTLASIVRFGHPDTVLSFLPLSHVLERMVTWAFLSQGCSIACAESVETVAHNLLEVRPNIMVSVPRLFEKLYARILDTVMNGPALKKRIFFWAVRVGKEHVRRRLSHQKISLGLGFKRKLADRFVFSKILAKIGGRVRFFVSGGAPLSKDIAEFFHAIGLVVLEGYGLTETSPVIAVNTFEDLRFGTVGKPIPGVEVRIAGDGEILAKGPNVMKGYYKKDAETREAFDSGGWFHTGDIGHLDQDGFLVITDRKKDLIVTAGGKNVAPQPIENLIKRNPYITNVVVVGAGRKFISALVVPDIEKLKGYALENRIAFESPKDLLENAAVETFVLDEIGRSTPNLAPYERVKKIILLERDFEIEREELTPTLKVKRAKVEERCRDLIDTLYQE